MKCNSFVLFSHLLLPQRFCSLSVIYYTREDILDFVWGTLVSHLQSEAVLQEVLVSDLTSLKVFENRIHNTFAQAHILLRIHFCVETLSGAPNEWVLLYFFR